MTSAADATGAPAPGAPHPEDRWTAMDPRMRARRMAVVRQRERRRLRWGLTAVAAVVAVVAAVAALHSPLFAARHLTVTGARHSGVAAVLGAAGLVGEPPLIDVDPGAAQRRVEALPWVARAHVERHWPDAVTVIVTERVAVGAVARPGGIALVDGTGRVLAWEPSAPPGMAVLGAGVVPGRPGTTLPAEARSVLAVARALPPSMAGRVAEVTLAAGTVALHLGGGLVAELGAPTGLAAKFGALAGVLARAAPSGPAVIDVSVPDAPTVGPPLPGPLPARPAS